MEAPVKERLTGALILIAVLVIVVPEMLSGPGGAGGGAPARPADSGPPLRSYSLQLDTPAARTGDQSTLSPQAVKAPQQAAPAATPVENTASPAAPAPQPPAVSGQAPPPAAEPQPAAAPAAAGQWWTQLGSFSSRDNAERLARDLRAAGYTINVARIKVGTRDLFRVRAGPVPDREAAVNLQSRLAAAGHKSALVAP